MGLAQIISKNLRAIRHQKGMSQRELAEAIDVDEKFISQLENKPRHISTKTLERLAEGLGVNNSDLLAHDDKSAQTDILPARYAPGLDEAIKVLRVLRSRVKVK